MRTKKSQVTEEAEEAAFDNASIVTYLAEGGCELTPYNYDSKVRFWVKGPISRLLAELQQNPKMPILSYIQRLSTIRSMIFQLKGQRKYGDPQR
jgi:hypothetical protein